MSTRRCGDSGSARDYKGQEGKLGNIAGRFRVREVTYRADNSPHVPVEQYERLIIFYNFDYELEQLRTLAYLTGREHYERNGHRHDPLPEGREWIYLVQYNASEGWNCVTTNAVLFYSLSYSWRSMEQAEGRIDRLNTAYVYLRYYTIISDSPIDKAIRLALSRKKVFNERAFEKGITSCDPATASATSSSTSS